MEQNTKAAVLFWTFLAASRMVPCTTILAKRWCCSIKYDRTTQLPEALHVKPPLRDVTKTVAQGQQRSTCVRRALCEDVG